MDIEIRPIQSRDRDPIMEILNHYVTHSFAAYPEAPYPTEAFDTFMASMAGYPGACMISPTRGTIGFGILRPYHPAPTFGATAEIAYFLKAGCTRRGLGQRLLAYLEDRARERGISQLLANVSSLNPASRAFHLKNGFREAGRFTQVVTKGDQTFDV
ncbi:MAG: N-acetyltransferase family protein, partial [Desulfobacterales bacterium]|nr:N-acetyltransferase family protein [Desulfobacterales bacterium]